MTAETFSECCARLIFEARDYEVKAGRRISPEIVKTIIENQVTAFGLKTPKPNSFDPRAEEIFQAYPRHIGKKSALKAIGLALKTESAPMLLTTVKAYAEIVFKMPHGARFTDRGRDTIPHPATWFNDARYLDDPKEWGVHEKPVTNGVDYSKGF